MDSELKIPRSVQTQNTKDKIYKATANIIKKKGYAYLSVSNICKAAGISNGTFFHHFKTKDELLAYYTYDNFSEYRRKNGFAEQTENKPFDERIVIFYHFWIAYMQEMGIEFFSSFYSGNNTALDVRKWNQRQPETIWAYPGTCLKEAYAQKLLKENLSLDQCVEILGCIIKGISFDWCVSGGTANVDYLLDELLGMYLRSIKRENA